MSASKEEAGRMVALAAQNIAGRAQVQNWRGKRADAYALEAACGALAAVTAMHGNEHPTANAFAMFATLVSVRGLAYVKERAADAAPAPAQSA